MAIIWARSTGTWSGSIWDYYDGNQVTSYPYSTPQTGDTVYCNGYNITNLPITLYFGNGTLSNESVDIYDGDVIVYTTTQGGYFQTTNGNLDITVNLRASFNYVLKHTTSSNNAMCSITGNIFCDASYAIYFAQNNTPTYIINGDVNLTPNSAILSSMHPQSGAISRIEITGSVKNIGQNTTVAYIKSSSVTNNNVNVIKIGDQCENITIDNLNTLTFPSVSMNGGWQASFSAKITNLSVIGLFKILNNSIISVSTLTINGNIEYENTNNKFGFTYSTLNIQNANTFTWKDITNPRSNPFFIVTEGELNDTYLYPSTSVVRDGIQYAANQRTGTYRPDYPIPQNVMKDVEYDSGLLIGTLDLPQAPTTSDIVTAIKNDSDLADLGGKINTTNTNVGNISTAVTTIDGKVDIIDTNVNTLLSRLTSVLTQRLGQSVTVEILQQILVAHLDN